MLLTTGRGLAALTLGEDVAHTLGNRPGTAASDRRRRHRTGRRWIGGRHGQHRLRRAGGAAPVAPHAIGHDARRLLWVAALGGAVLLLAADIAVRLVVVGQELKLGVATALVGAPFFLWQVLRMRGTS